MKAKRILWILIMPLFIVCILGACGSRKASSDTSVSGAKENTVSEAGQEGTGEVQETDMNTKNISEHEVPQELATISNDYYQAANQQGTLVELTYSTYESKTYEQKSNEITKRAIVYLPYGYTKENKYNVFYLMHGGWSNETTTLGTSDQPNSFKNVIDNAIEKGEIKPLIFVAFLIIPLKILKQDNYML